MDTHWFKESLLNSLLALLVTISLFLTIEVWYPGERLFGQDGSQLSLQPQPPPIDRQMPDVFRPARILVGRMDRSVASLHLGTSAYSSIWRTVSRVLNGLQASGGAYLIDHLPEEIADGPRIELYLPTSLMLSEWADLWGWNTPTLRNGSIWVDKLTVSLSQPSSIYLEGPYGSTLYMTDLDEELRNDLLAATGWMEPSLFSVWRPFEREGLDLVEGPELLVPQVSSLPMAEVQVALPDERAEEARFFPDLSVVRQIDEREARSLTDGQRLLRITSAGLLEYRTADSTSSATTPEMHRAISLVQEWVGQRGGWPQEIVLRRFSRQPGRAKLEFDLRAGGAYPVESTTPMLQLHVSAQRVVYFARRPAPISFRFDEEQQQPIISPEKALQGIRSHVPVLGTAPIRSVYLAYELKPISRGGAVVWELEPAWVFQVADTRLFVFAGTEAEAFDAEIIN